MTSPPKNRFSQGIAFLYIIFLISLDQSIKFIILRNFTLGESLPVINSVFHITLVFNKGAAFGIFANATIAFILISALVIVIISFFLSRPNISYDTRLALASILAGATSNLIDRLRFGYVVDFLDFRIWPVFNIADAAITLGTLWLVWKILIKDRKNASGVV